MKCSAIFSSDPARRWRYQLRRIWDESLPLVAFVGLNPSTADETQDDPTVRRCRAFAKWWGFGGLIMTNAFAFRATDPRVMMAAVDPVGPDNDLHLMAVAAEAQLVMAAWGNRGVFQSRSERLADMLGELWALEVTVRNQPRHPLYVRGDVQRILWHLPTKGSA
jgi:hypothetical protein